jgi:hypothetical protein
MKSSTSSFHLAYIAGSCVAALLALVGIQSGSPLLYATLPGIIGGISATIATVRFLKDKADLAGFVATFCGFVFDQAYQANPVTQLAFVSSLQDIPAQDQAIGLFLSNLTTAMLLLSFRIVGTSFHRRIGQCLPDSSVASRIKVDRRILLGFWVIFAVVATPNVLFGKVVVGAIDNIIYQRMAWSDPENYSGFAVWGGALGSSIANMALWATSLFLLWMYLLRSRYWCLMLILSPLVLLWTASVGLQGSRTYLVTMGVAVIVYFLGNPKTGKKVFAYAALVMPLLFVLLQMSTLFRDQGLQGVDVQELGTHMLDIHGNEGASSQIDGIQFFRTELLEKGRAPNPVVGIFKGLIWRLYEGLLIPVPRSLFPWKAYDHSADEFSVFFQNVRLGNASSEAFLGASPGLIGRELIKYGLFGPLTLYFWMGLILAVADRFFSADNTSDFHRIVAALLIAFIVAQARDFTPLWFLPFLPAGVILGSVARKAKKSRPAKSGMAPEPGLAQVSGAAK